MMDKSIIDQITRTRLLSDRELKRLESIREGSYCIHGSWGLGQIQGYDSLKDKLKIVFEDGTEHLMDPVFCVEKLKILSEDSILVQFKNNPSDITDKTKNEPIKLIYDLIENSPYRELAFSEIEFTFKRIVGKVAFRRWWTGVKKLIEKDPLVMLSPKRSNTYVFRAQPINMAEEIVEQLQIHKDPAKKIEIATKILNLPAESQLEIINEIKGIIEDFGNAMVSNDKRLSIAQKLTFCWIRNDLAEAIGEDVEYFGPTPEFLIRGCNNLEKITEELSATFYDRFLLLVTCAFPDEWEERCANLLKNSQGRFTNECMLFLIERGCHDFLKDRLNRWLNEHSLKSPLLHWIIKNRHARKFSEVVSKGLINFRLLKSIFGAIDSDASANASSKRIPLAELIVEDRNLIRDLLADASEENVEDLFQILMQNQWFDGLTKRLLLARFIKEFPSLQLQISGKVSEKPTVDTSLMVSQLSYDAKREEYETLVNEKIPANTKAIGNALKHGDLKENSEYKMACQDQDLLLLQRDRLEADLKKAQIIDFATVSSDTVGIGTVVRLKSNLSQEVSEYAILGAWDSDPDHNILSYKTPLAQSLISKQVGDTVEINIGDKTSSWKIESIMRYVDCV